MVVSRIDSIKFKRCSPSFKSNSGRGEGYRLFVSKLNISYLGLGYGGSVACRLTICYLKYCPFDLSSREISCTLATAIIYICPKNKTLSRKISEMNAQNRKKHFSIDENNARVIQLYLIMNSITYVVLIFTALLNCCILRLRQIQSTRTIGKITIFSF